MRKLIPTFFLIFAGFVSFAQSVAVPSIRYKNDPVFLKDFVHRVYTTSDGLPGMSIIGIIQDKKGYIWICTYDGLVRFDGVEFVTFSRYTNEKFDFASARSLLQDAEGNLWVGHNGEGISVIRTDGTITKYTKDDGLCDNKVNEICEDKNGNIWCGTAGGLCYITKEGEFVIPEGLSDLGLSNVTVARLMCDSAGRVWISTGSENCVLVYSNKKIRRFEGITKIENPTVRAIYQDKSGAFWFGVDPCYVVKIKDNEETVYDVRHENIAGTAIESIMQDSNGNYWFTTDAGITVMHGNSFSYYDKTSGAADNGTNEVLEDREGNFWILYNRGGLEKLSAGKFQTVPMNASVNSICEDKHRGVTWIACDNGVYAYKNNQFVENNVTEFCKGSRARHVGMTSDGELLISMYSAKMPQICVKLNDEITVWNEENGLTDIKCRVAIKTKNGDYYAGLTKGLAVLKNGEDKFIMLTKADGLKNDYIMWLYEDEKERVWVGTNGGGVYVLKDMKFVAHYGTEEGLAGNVVFKICEIGTNIWIATGTGISEFNEETDSFVSFNSKMGLGTDSVFQILVDYTNTAWMTTNKGIFSADFSEMLDVVQGMKSKVSVKYYGNSDGLITNGVTSVSLGTIDSLGRAWFPLVDGLALYDPAKSGKNKIAPPLVVQDYAIDNESFEYHGEKIILPPGTKRFTLKYTGLSFISSESIRFKYMLDGFDTDFSDWTNLRIATYTNLKHGTYFFRIMAQNSDEVSGEAKIIQIVKEPYLWELVWFWALIGGAVLLVAIFIVLHKIRSMRRYQIELEQKVEERTHELKVANKKAENLLLNILPKPIAAELTEHPDRTIAKSYPNATVLFTDIVGFTKMSGKMTAKNVVSMLNLMISRFDERAKKMGIEKIKTIGDAYMAAVGLTETPDTEGAAKMVQFARGLISDVEAFNAKYNTKIQIRLGINTGELVAGVIGKTKFIYDIWGDTVNVASRMESTGEPMRIHVSETTRAQTQNQFSYGEGIDVEVKGKGLMKTYYL